jgi:hypothetical protein
MIELRDNHLGVLRHMLGIDTPRVKSPNEYRDYYCANPGSIALLELEAFGMVVRYSEEGGYHWFKTTDLGKEKARESQQKMLLPKAKRRYLSWLSVRDSIPDLSFKDFLTLPEYKKARNV